MELLYVTLAAVMEASKSPYTGKVRNPPMAVMAVGGAQEHQKAWDSQAYFGSELQGVLDANPMTRPSVP